ncbi:polyhydroxyalkanoic acid system protein [Longimonas halophila]|uniref:Polyhydroxyalkanoic acid system protein n=1 Tax=Longimonas halophila TaxID=1469170 RepID=A0A2H3P7X9_9BACT|nr:polyhydroxyalkanoic acid system family protein [Longimonas halophila]PEN08758.1 polyhydroxyalkanoic acid system protein [Longimonas halophila]
MSTINLSQSHSMGTSGARTAVEKVADQLKQKLGADYHWEDDTLKFDGGGASGTIDVQPEEVRVEIELGMLLSAMKGTVKKQAQGYLDQYLK